MLFLFRILPFTVLFFFLPIRICPPIVRLAFTLSVAFLAYPEEMLQFVLGQFLPPLPKAPEVVISLAWGLLLMLALAIPVLSLRFLSTWLDRLVVVDRVQSLLVGQRKISLFATLVHLFFLSMLLYSSQVESLMVELASALQFNPLVMTNPSSTLPKEALKVLTEVMLAALVFFAPLGFAFLAFYSGVVVFDRLFRQSDIAPLLIRLAPLLIACFLFFGLSFYAGSLEEFFFQLSIEQYLRETLNQMRGVL